MGMWPVGRSDRVIEGSSMLRVYQRSLSRVGGSHTPKNQPRDDDSGKYEPVLASILAVR
jgi:hypothetical protein